jgi:putative ABC transport system permease protein
MARALWPGRSPLGQRVRTGGETPREYQVVGVAPDMVYARHVGIQPTIYLSWEQAERAEGVLHVRFRPGARGLEPALIEAASGTGVALFGVRTLTALRRDAAFPQRLTGVLLTVFGSIALLLAGVGLYGVVAYGVAQRTREIGVRIALGARPAQVRRLIVRQGIRMAAVGVGFGLVLAFGLAQALRTLLFGVGAADPFTFVGVSLLLLSVAAAASWMPARRAAALEPMRALRSE